MIYIGIDPGSSGGLAALWADGRVLVAQPMPKTEKDLLDMLSGLASTHEAGTHAVLEQLRPMPSTFRGGKGNWYLGGSYFAMRMALIACGIPFDEAVPRKWQGAMQCLTGGDKNVSKRRATELFPTVTKITHATADALLIAEYCRRRCTKHDDRP